jgi:hypothetical protein
MVKPDAIVRERILRETLAAVLADAKARGLPAEVRDELGRHYVLIGGEIEAVVGVWPAEHRPGIVVEARRADGKRPWRPSSPDKT